MPHINSSVTQRFCECIQVLIEDRRISDDAEFARKTDIPETELNDFRSGARNVTVDHISKGVSQFRFNPCYLFGGEGRPLLNLVLKVDYRKIEDVLSIRSDERVRFHSVTSR
jgi:hypothetical protein